MIKPPEPTEPNSSQQNVPLIEEVTPERQIKHNIGLTEKEYRLYTHITGIELFELFMLISLSIFSNILYLILINVVLYIVCQLMLRYSTKMNNIYYQVLLTLIISSRIVIYGYHTSLLFWKIINDSFNVLMMLETIPSVVCVMIIFYVLLSLFTLFNSVTNKSEYPYYQQLQRKQQPITNSTGYSYNSKY